MDADATDSDADWRIVEESGDIEVVAPGGDGNEDNN